jgi:hypothetical protein
LSGDGPSPAQVLVDAYPRFGWKQGLRNLADLPLPNGFFDVVLGTPPLHWLASAIFFHRRGAAAMEGAQAEAGRELRIPAE